MARPNFHFTPPKGWMNDPNGLVKIGEEYHIFYQYYPEDAVWGPMHWGHAVTKDLSCFEHKKIALYPDDLGYIFSGSCILDKDNRSGLGSKEHPALLAFYTSHNPETGEQQQSIAYSLDYETFAKYERNPVISNRVTDVDYKKDFRDPKVFYYAKSDCYFMVLAAGVILEFYQSKNLLKWEFAGIFDPGKIGFTGICECPDCFYLPMETVGKPFFEEANECSLVTEQPTGKWILSISMILPEEKQGNQIEKREYSNGHVMQYFVGEFMPDRKLLSNRIAENTARKRNEKIAAYDSADEEAIMDILDGDLFQVDKGQTGPLILDYGPDAYAMVSFANTEPGRMLAWGEHWDYAQVTPMDENAFYRGKLSAIRQATLKRIGEQYYLAFEPMGVEYETFELKEGEHKAYEIKDGGAYLDIRVEENQIVVNRSRAISYAFADCLKEEAYQVFRSKRLKNGSCNFKIVQDEGYFEIFAEDGLHVFSVMTYV